MGVRKEAREKLIEVYLNPFFWGRVKRGGV